MVACYAAEMVSTSVRAVCINPGTAATKLYKTAYPGHVDTTLPSADAAAAKIVAALSAL